MVAALGKEGYARASELARGIVEQKAEINALNKKREEDRQELQALMVGGNLREFHSGSHKAVLDARMKTSFKSAEIAANVSPEIFEKLAHKKATVQLNVDYDPLGGDDPEEAPVEATVTADDLPF